MKKVLMWIIGLASFFAFILGILMLLPSKAIIITIAVIIICLSLAFGLLLPNPISFSGLLSGIGMLILPPIAVGIIFIICGIVLTLVNSLIFKKIH